MKNKRLIVIVSVFVTVVMVTVFTVKAAKVKRIINQLDRQIELTEKELNKDKERIKELEKEREEMDTLPYIEKIAREKLGMVKADDIVFKEKNSSN